MLGFALAPSMAHGAAIVLTFEGLQNTERILQFYNGGTGSLGSAGPNYGIGFAGTANQTGCDEITLGSQTPEVKRNPHRRRR